jgi:hypothetical protein
MRRLLAILVIAASGLALSACGSGSSASVDTNSQSYADGYHMGHQAVVYNKSEASGCGRYVMNDLTAGDLWSDWLAGCQQGYRDAQ